jgi:hypothetical protein
MHLEEEIKKISDKNYERDRSSTVTVTITFSVGCFYLKLEEHGSGKTVTSANESLQEGLKILFE